MGTIHAFETGDRVVWTWLRRGGWGEPEVLSGVVVGRAHGRYLVRVARRSLAGRLIVEDKLVRADRLEPRRTRCRDLGE